MYVDSERSEECINFTIILLDIERSEECIVFTMMFYFICKHFFG